MGKLDFSGIINRDREEHKSKRFEGTFLEYLNIVKENPEISMLAHQRMFKLITEPGIETIKTDENPRLRRIYGNDVVKKYKFFEDEFFGIDNTIMKIVRYFHSAAMAGEEARQVLYLVGPVGAGKSSLMEAIKRALEMSPPIYAIKGCPIREEPLHLVPKH
ncbi:MAG: serine protein kinase, partial [Clostridiaceae bacterium]|nr:serine protein kinase [Clostridiaceae bacterium]